MHPQEIVCKLALSFALCLPVLAQAEEAAGHWIGRMDSGFQVRIDIDRTPAGYTASLTNPSGATTPIDRITSDGMDLRFVMDKLGLSYDGRWNAQAQRWEGTLHFQGEHAMQLRRVTAADRQATGKRPQEAAIAAGPLSYDTRDAMFTNPATGLALAGTLTLPRGPGPFPAVVLVPGTGPNGRDEDIGTHKWLLVLADALTRRGIAVLRYDKRGVGGSGGRYFDADSADFALDAKAAFDYLRGVPGIDAARVGLAGHSEGGVIAPMVAATKPEVAWIVLLASPALRGDRLFLAQAATVSRLYGVPASHIERRQAFDRRLYDAVMAAPDGAKARQRAIPIVQQGVADGIVDAAEADKLPRDVSTRWERYFLAHDPASVLSRLRLPVLVLNGALDAQVPAANTAVFRTALAANARARIEELPGKNHLLQDAGTGAPNEYEAIETTIAPDALEAIGKWILDQAKRMVPPNNAKAQ
jgi:pimeloyl-ACP methyl ester carboxylesterase